MLTGSTLKGRFERSVWVNPSVPTLDPVQLHELRVKQPWPSLLITSAREGLKGTWWAQQIYKPQANMAASIANKTSPALLKIANQ
jgi:hypothetical protein